MCDLSQVVNFLYFSLIVHLLLTGFNRSSLELFFGGGGTPVAHGGSQAWGRIGAVAAGAHHSHSNTRSEPCLCPTPQLVAALGL